jgi:hypothetical protein
VEILREGFDVDTQTVSKVGIARCIPTFRAIGAFVGGKGRDVTSVTGVPTRPNPKSAAPGAGTAFDLVESSSFFFADSEARRSERIPEILTPKMPVEVTKLESGTGAGGASDAVAASIAAAASAVTVEAVSRLDTPDIVVVGIASGSSLVGTAAVGRLAKKGRGTVFLFGLSITGAASNFKCGLAALYF